MWKLTFSSRVSLARTALRSTEDMVRCGMLHGVVYREVKDDPAHRRGRCAFKAFASSVDMVDRLPLRGYLTW